MAEFYTQGMLDTDLEYIEREQQRLRCWFAFSQDPKNNVPREWRLDGIDFKKLMDGLDAEREYLIKKRRFEGFRYSQRRRDVASFQQSVTPKQNWQIVDAAFAVAARNAGVPVKYTGKWMVRTR